MIEKDELENFHKEKNDDICLDFDHGPVLRITDEWVEKIAKQITGYERISMLQSLPEEQKTGTVKALLREGASIRQINRLTGITIRVIQKYKENQ